MAPLSNLFSTSNERTHFSLLSVITVSQSLPFLPAITCTRKNDAIQSLRCIIPTNFQNGQRKISQRTKDYFSRSWGSKKRRPGLHTAAAFAHTRHRDKNKNATLLVLFFVSPFLCLSVCKGYCYECKPTSPRSLQGAQSL